MSSNLSEERATAARPVLAALGDVLVLTEPHLIWLWKSAGLTFVQLRVLRTLGDRPASPGELAAAVGVSTASMARTLSRLEERGLIARSIDPRDRRRIEVSLQPEGGRLLSDNRLWRGTAFERAVLSLGPEHRQQLVEALRGLADAVRRELAVQEGAEVWGAAPSGVGEGRQAAVVAPEGRSR